MRILVRLGGIRRLRPDEHWLRVPLDKGLILLPSQLRSGDVILDLAPGEPAQAVFANLAQAVFVLIGPSNHGARRELYLADGAHGLVFMSSSTNAQDDSPGEGTHGDPEREVKA